MKKVLLVFILICSVILSCKKNHQGKTGQSDDPQQVSFNVSFKQLGGAFQTNSVETNAVTNADTSLTNHLYLIHYIVFDAAGKYVSHTTQLFNDANFGHFTMLLQPGNYTIAVAGGRSGLEIVPFTGTLTTAYLWYNNGTSDPYNHYFKETFFYKAAITVGHANLTQNISLTRITSRIQFNIEDAIPQNATVATIGISAVSGLLNFRYYIGDGSVDNGDIPTNHDNFSASTAIPAAAVGTTNYQVSGDYLYSAAQTVNATLAITNPITKITYGSVQINDINAGGANKLVHLTGKMFGGTPVQNSNGFHMSVDTAWNATVVKGF